jgi:Uma2 family endonuclease
MSVSTPPFLTKEWPEQGQWTYKDWERLPSDGNKYEVIDGVLYVTPSPITMHQFSSNRLATMMTNYADAQDLGYICTAPMDVRLPNQPVPFQPDILFIRAERREIIQQWIEGVPDLAVEIISPSSASYDRAAKFRIYEEAGVPEYWIVDPRARTVEVFVLEENEYVLLGRWNANEAASSRVLAGFEVPVAAIFRDL